MNGQQRRQIGVFLVMTVALAVVAINGFLPSHPLTGAVRGGWSKLAAGAQVVIGPLDGGGLLVERPTAAAPELPSASDDDHSASAPSGSASDGSSPTATDAVEQSSGGKSSGGKSSGGTGSHQGSGHSQPAEQPGTQHGSGSGQQPGHTHGPAQGHGHGHDGTAPAAHAGPGPASKAGTDSRTSTTRGTVSAHHLHRHGARGHRHGPHGHGHHGHHHRR